MDEQQAADLMRACISAHLSERITMGDLGKVIKGFPWHVYQLFQSRIGMTSAQYIRGLRLSRAALRLRKDRTTVIEVAMESGFESVDGFQRAFLRMFGRNPLAYAGSLIPLNRMPEEETMQQIS